MARHKGVRRLTHILERRDEVAKRYLAGESQVQIALALRVSQPTVCDDLAKLRQQWVASSQLNIGELIAQELARIDRVEAEAWQAWQRSQQAREVTTEGTDGDTSHSSIRRESSAGDSAFLSVIVNCSKRRSELLGLDAAKKTHVHLGGQINCAGMVSLTAEDLAAADLLLRETERLTAGAGGNVESTE